MRRARWLAAGLFPPFGVLAKDPSLARGLDLYAKHCAVCHGETGRGDGPGASLNRPLPRDFATGMPPWNHLPEADRNALVDAVLHLAQEGHARKLFEAAREEDEEMTFEEARRIAREKLEAGPTIPAGPATPSTPQAVERGRAVFARNCASCHGTDGRGKRDPEWRTAEGDAVLSR